MFFYLLPLQLSFDFNYDEEIEHFLDKLHISHSVAKFLAFVPEFLLIIDTLLKFITGYYENGLVITNKAKICHHYLKKGLIFDILAYCPIIAHSFLKMWTPGIFILRIFQLLMFFKIRRVQIVLQNFQEMISLEGKTDYLLSIFIIAYEIAFFTHIMACIWHGWAYYELSTEITWNMPNKCSSKPIING